MTDKEFEELENKYKAEVEKREMLKKISDDIDFLNQCKDDDPSFKVRNRTITMTPELKLRVCNFIVSNLIALHLEVKDESKT